MIPVWFVHSDAILIHEGARDPHRACKDMGDAKMNYVDPCHDLKTIYACSQKLPTYLLNAHLLGLTFTPLGVMLGLFYCS